MKLVIEIKKYLSSTIITRKSIEVLKAACLEESLEFCVFDFSEIDFISRAFADEFIHFIKTLDIKTEIINTNENVTEMIDAVQRNRGKRKSSYRKIAVTKFGKTEELDRFLSLI
ncbi:hypothetical protein EYV94_07790 [Puteibacter caeruleilacunae]|nr:hypothetical protein EYV94_07790 [Puteibacter caeruleilacunae]